MLAGGSEVYWVETTVCVLIREECFDSRCKSRMNRSMRRPEELSPFINKTHTIPGPCISHNIYTLASLI